MSSTTFATLSLKLFMTRHTSGNKLSLEHHLAPDTRHWTKSGGEGVSQLKLGTLNGLAVKVADQWTNSMTLIKLRERKCVCEVRRTSTDTMRRSSSSLGAPRYDLAEQVLAFDSTASSRHTTPPEAQGGSKRYCLWYGGKRVSAHPDTWPLLASGCSQSTNGVFSTLFVQVLKCVNEEEARRGARCRARAACLAHHSNH